MHPTSATRILSDHAEPADVSVVTHGGTARECQGAELEEEYLRAYKQPNEHTRSHSLVEKLRRKFKCHRGALDFDFRFIRDA